MKLLTALVSTAIVFSSNTIAQTERELDSHEHGHASLNIAIDEKSVFIEMESPWNNLVGFEHAPITPEQKTLVDDALALLNNPESLFSFSGTECVVADVDLDNNIATLTDGEHHDEHSDEHSDEHGDEHTDGHDDEHKEEHKDEHEDGHSDEHHDDEHESASGTHSSVLMTATFECKDVSKLSSIGVNIFSTWSGFDELDVQLIGPGGQTAVELSPAETTVDLKQVQ